MNKKLINKLCRKFGFEVHGTGYIQSVEQNLFKADPFSKQKDLLDKQVKTIFDLGANRGYTILRYHNLYPSAKIYAFEPFPDTFDILRNNTKDIENVFAYQKAISDSIRNSTFFVNHNVDTNSLLESKKIGLSSDKHVVNKQKIEVDVVTLDSFCENNQIPEIDILKMDIQGGELAALEGAVNLLNKKKIHLIYTEAYFKEQYLNQPLLHDISKFLHGYGYYTQDIYNPIYGKGSLAWCDAIFLPKGK